MKTRKICIPCFLVLVFFSNAGCGDFFLRASETPETEQNGDFSGPGHLTEGAFSLVLMPDTQHYLKYRSKAYMYDDQIDWIIEKQQEENIVMMLHLGDMIDSYSQPGVSEWEWEYFTAGTDRLKQAGIPFGLALGNHDYNRLQPRDSNMFNEYLPLDTVYGDMPGFGGAFEAGRSDNVYHLFEAGGYKWLVFSLELGPRNAVLDWASDLIASRSDHLVIIVTHAYLDENNELLGRSHGKNPRNYNMGQDVNDAEDIWEKLVRRHANIRLVFCGHCGSNSGKPGGPDGAGFLASTGDHGNTVYQIMSNYQYYVFSLSGYIRLMRFHVSGDPLLEIVSYNPTYNRVHQDTQHTFTRAFYYF